MADTDNDYVVVVRATSGTGGREKTADQTITVTVTDEAGRGAGRPGHADGVVGLGKRVVNGVLDRAVERRAGRSRSYDLPVPH